MESYFLINSSIHETIGENYVYAEYKNATLIFTQTKVAADDLYKREGTQNNVCGILDRYYIQKKKTHGFWVIHCQGLFESGYVKHSLRFKSTPKKMDNEYAALNFATKFHHKWGAKLFCWLYNKDSRAMFRLRSYSIKWIHKP